MTADELIKKINRYKYRIERMGYTIKIHQEISPNHNIWEADEIVRISIARNDWRWCHLIQATHKDCLLIAKENILRGLWELAEAKNDD